MMKVIIPATLAMSLLTFFVGAANASAAEAASQSTIRDFGIDSLIKMDGTYWIWGQNHSVPTQIHELSDVAASYADRVIMKKDLSVWHWEPTSSATAYKLEPIPTLTDIASITDAWEKTFIIEKDGDVFVTPRLNGTTLDWGSMKQVDGLDHVKNMSLFIESPSYNQQQLFLKTDGTVWKSEDKLGEVYQVSNLDHVVDVSNKFALKQDGTVWAVDTSSATRLSELSDIQMIRSNGNSTVAIDKQSHLWFWGVTFTGVSDGTVLHDQTPIQITSLSGVADAFVVERTLLALTKDGSMYSTSINLETMSVAPRFELLATRISSVKAGPRHLIMQKSDGTLWGWGVNKEAMLGKGDYEFQYTTPVAVQKPITVELNGDNIALSNGVIIQDGQAFVPLRSIFEKMGAAVKWDLYSKKATIQSADTATQIEVNFMSSNHTLNGKTIKMSVEPFIVNGTVYLPLRFISESLGAKVDWVQQESRITITMK
ncbi:stalk domain-containing protein [Paenibacillus sp. OV219]|uniref:stalk domain-containing protein n=1 Tax=Paenibacillus sp. OV219 TaxID=1884377 RepID=UPI0008B07F32|nr:stalk domain-containing protein [Paenibacillus sp. OV219]SEO55833.1 Copper amine oxidase N-terminal domain-containing protein [Paenibacillus sp. OV219]